MSQAERRDAVLMIAERTKCATSARRTIGLPIYSCYRASMMAFTRLELAALDSIFSETPKLASELWQQLQVSDVVERENSGSGFFTTIAVADDALSVSSPRVLGCETHARVTGLEHGLGFVLFMEGGRMRLLEGFAWGSESTAALDLTSLKFKVYREPVHRVH